MITLVCTKCGTTLSVDDGFAGGVCRCSACGTIQTVPRRGDDAGRRTPAGESIYERKGRAQTSKELEALGEIVTSSGLAGSGMLDRSRSLPRTPPRPAGSDAARRKMIMTIAGAALALVVVTAIAIWLALRSADSAATAAANANASPTASGARSAAGPRFGPIALDQTGPVVYLIDRGDATRAYTVAIQEAVLRSIETLGSKRRFQVRYWTSGSDAPVFPSTPAEATPANRAKLTSFMNDVIGGQSTDALETLAAALAANPAEIVMITGKGWQLDDTFVNESAVRIGSKKVRIHGVSLGSSADGGATDALGRLASRTGGQSLQLSAAELARLDQP